MVEGSVEQFNQANKHFFPGLVGVEFTCIEPGHTICRLEVTPRCHHPGGVMHGGVPYTLADTGMALAVLSGLSEGQRCATIEIKMTYLKAVINGEITCETRVINKGRRIVFLESDIRNGSGLVAQATGTFYVSDNGKP